MKWQVKWQDLPLEVLRVVDGRVWSSASNHPDGGCGCSCLTATVLDELNRQGYKLVEKEGK